MSAIMAQGGEIVGGEEDGEIIFLPDLVQHIQQQMLSPHIDPGQRLVQNENLRNGLQRQGQQHPLELPAGEGADALLNQRLTVDPGQALGYLVPQMAGTGRKTGQRLMAAAKKSRTLMG